MHDNHRHETLDPSRTGKDGDLGIMGVLIHVGGDAANNIGVIIAGAVIWKTKSPRRYYADPAVGVAIALMIFLSSIPLGSFGPFGSPLAIRGEADRTGQSKRAD